jgi:VWFA-related protein
MTGTWNQRPRLQRALVFLLSFMIAPSFHARSQAGAPMQKQEQAGGTFRVRVGLVQVDMTVFDKQGNFVVDLKPEQIDLLVDSEPQPISFLERIATAGPPTEQALAKAKKKRGSTETRPAPIRSDRGRTLLFFLDDWHLSAESTQRARAALSALIDSVMGPNDHAAVFTASRQLGFLQQVTDSKSVVKLALTRLAFTNETVHDLSRPPMNEAQALAIEQGDSSLTEWFVNATIAVEGLEDVAGMAESIVRYRASGLAMASAEVTARCLDSLRRLVQSCAVLPGRKVIFFLSDGFVLQQQRDDVSYRLKQVTDAALNAGVVIYSLDTRGLIAGQPDVGTPYTYLTPNPDPQATDPYIMASTGPLPQEFSNVLAYQDGLNALASDTGGRLMKNTNAFDEAILDSLAETSEYYLLGWYVNPDTLKPGKYSSIEVSIRERPDLKVQVRQKSLNLSKLFSEEKDRAELATPSKAGGKELAMALQYPWPIEGLPISLYSGFVYNPGKKQYVLGIWADMSGEAQGEASIDILGIVANRDGKTIAGFQNNPSETEPSSSQRLTYNHMLQIDPGIYQVRLAAHAPKIGRLGSAHQWVEVTLPTTGNVQLGSIFLKRQAPLPGHIKRDRRKRATPVRGRIPPSIPGADLQRDRFPRYRAIQSVPG